MLISLFLTFLKIGCVAFGGGYAMIPLITDECVSQGWLTSEEIMNFIAISESTPGPIAINMATFVGASQAGLLGAFMATLGVLIPSFIIIFVIVAVFNKLLKLAGVDAFLKGVRPVVIGLIVATGISLFLTVMLGFSKVGDNISFNYKSLVIFSIIVIAYFVYKKIKKKNMPPLLIIVFSALLGLLFFGLSSIF